MACSRVFKHIQFYIFSFYFPNGFGNKLKVVFTYIFILTLKVDTYIAKKVLKAVINGTNINKFKDEKSSLKQ